MGILNQMLDESYVLANIRSGLVQYGPLVKLLQQERQVPRRDAYDVIRSVQKKGWVEIYSTEKRNGRRNGRLGKVKVLELTDLGKARIS